MAEKKGDNCGDSPPKVTFPFPSSFPSPLPNKQTYKLWHQPLNSKSPTYLRAGMGMRRDGRGYRDRLDGGAGTSCEW